jgi:hypothetical protein
MRRKALGFGCASPPAYTRRGIRKLAVSVGELGFAALTASLQGIRQFAGWW